MSRSSGLRNKEARDSSESVDGKNSESIHALRSRAKRKRETSGEPQTPLPNATIASTIKEGGNVLALLAGAMPEFNSSYESRSPKKAKLASDSQAGPAEPASTSATLPSLNVADLNATIPLAVNAAYAKGQFPISPTNSPAPVPAELDVATIPARQQGLVGLNLLPDDGPPAVTSLTSNPDHQYTAQQERILESERQVSMLNASIKDLSNSLLSVIQSVHRLNSSVEALDARIDRLEQLTTTHATPITQGARPSSSVTILPDDAELLAAPMMHLDPNKGTGKS